MQTYKYVNQDNLVVFIIEPNGKCYNSCLASSLPEGTIILPADPAPNPRIVEIKTELAAIDQRRIRPIAEGDTNYLAALNEQAAALRIELGGLNG